MQGCNYFQMMRLVRKKDTSAQHIDCEMWRVYLQVVEGVDQDTGHQVRVSTEGVNTLFCGGAEHFHAFSRGTQQEPAPTLSTFYRQIHKPVVSDGARRGLSFRNKPQEENPKREISEFPMSGINKAFLFYSKERAVLTASTRTAVLFRNTLKYQRTS